MKTAFRLWGFFPLCGIHRLDNNVVHGCRERH